MALAGKDEMDMDDFLSMMDTAVQAVEQRGKATVEEATMLDAMVPSLKAMKTRRQRERASGKRWRPESGQPGPAQSTPKIW